VVVDDVPVDRLVPQVARELRKEGDVVRRTIDDALASKALL